MWCWHPDLRRRQLCDRGWYGCVSDGCHPKKGRLEKIAELDRLDLRGKYDPGGLHRIEFQPLPDGDLVILHEVASPESLRRANSFGRAFTINFRHALNIWTKLRYGFRVRTSPLDSVSTTESSLGEHPEAPRTAFGVLCVNSGDIEH